MYFTYVKSIHITCILLEIKWFCYEGKGLESSLREIFVVWVLTGPSRCCYLAGVSADGELKTNKCMIVSLEKLLLQHLHVHYNVQAKQKI